MVYFVSNTVFLLFGSSLVQPWARKEECVNGKRKKLTKTISEYCSLITCLIFFCLILKEALVPDDRVKIGKFLKQNTNIY